MGEEESGWEGIRRGGRGGEGRRKGGGERREGWTDDILEPCTNK